jgi:MoxR-like ATPase
MSQKSAPFSSIDDARTRLDQVDYLADERCATVVALSVQLEKPLLVEGPAGVGKTELARAMAAAQGLRLIRLQCYEGLDEAKALYEWEYGKQLLFTQMLKDRIGELTGGGRSLEEAVAALDDEASAFFSERFLLPRPLLAAIQSDQPALLLIDEVDKADPHFEAFLLELLGDFQVTLPELGTLKAKTRPQILLTSNASRDLSDALKRRCLHLFLDMPSTEMQKAIVQRHVPQLDPALVEAVVRTLERIAGLDLLRLPSMAEAIDWGRALVALGRTFIDAETLRITAGVLSKDARDQARIADEAAQLVVP